MFIKEDDLKLNGWQFAQRKYLPYETKLKLTETRRKFLSLKQEQRNRKNHSLRGR